MKMIDKVEILCNYEGKTFICLKDIFPNRLCNFKKGELYILEQAYHYGVEHVLRDINGKCLLYEFVEYPHIYKNFEKDFELIDI